MRCDLVGLLDALVEKEVLMLTAAARFLALVLLIAATPAGAQNAPVQDTDTLDPTPPGTLHPEPLPPLANPDAPSTPARELFVRKSTPFPGPPRSIGGYFDGCLAGALCRCRSLDVR